jgi:hypothetical protein
VLFDEFANWAVQHSLQLEDVVDADPNRPDSLALFPAPLIPSSGPSLASPADAMPTSTAVIVPTSNAVPMVDSANAVSEPSEVGGAVEALDFVSEAGAGAGSLLEEERSRTTALHQESAARLRLLGEERDRLLRGLVAAQEKIAQLTSDTSRPALVARAAGLLNKLSAWVGIQIAKADPPRKGVSVVKILKGSAALGAGLELGHVVERVNGQETLTSALFAAAVRKAAPGDRVYLQVSE